MLLIMDLDDTLLPKNNILSLYTINTLKEAQLRGHLIVFNTARGLKPTLPIYNQFCPDYLILNGGSSIYDKNLNLLYEKRISLNHTIEILNFLKKKKLNHILVECGDGFISDDDYTIDKYGDVTKINFSNITKGALKIVFEDEKDENANYLKNKYNLDIVNYVGGKLHKISINTKAVGNKILLEILGNDIKTVCFGDDLGDIDMLLEANIGVRMKNSQPLLKKYNFLETKETCDNDGVAIFIKEKILKEG